MHTATEPDFEPELPSSDIKEEEMPVELIVRPTVDDFEKNSTAILLRAGDNTLTVYCLKDREGVTVGHRLDIYDAMGVLDMIGALPANTDVIGVFRIDEVLEGSFFPWCSGEVFVRPGVDEEGIVNHLEIVARNNLPDFTVSWTYDNGFEVIEYPTGKQLMVAQEVDEENPLRLGHPAFMIVPLDSDEERVVYNVYGELTELQWSAFTGSALAMLFGTLEGFTFSSGIVSLEDQYTDEQDEDILHPAQYGTIMMSDFAGGSRLVDLPMGMITAVCH